MKRQGLLLLTLFFLNFSIVAVQNRRGNPKSPRTQAAESFEVKGLSGPAEILVDRWGVPHMYASTLYDAFFVQGFNAARDRLWQIDLWRRRGLGELAAVFGPSYVEKDRAARLFLYRGDMYREWLAYGSDSKRIAEAFVAGINAFVGEAKRNPSLMPLEFNLLGYEPAVWKPQDVVRVRSHGLTRNVTSEIARAQVACHIGLSADEIRRGLEPAWKSQLPSGLDVCSIPEKVLDVYALATQNVTFDKERLPEARAGIEDYEFTSRTNSAYLHLPQHPDDPLLAGPTFLHLHAASLSWILPELLKSPW